MGLNVGPDRAEREDESDASCNASSPTERHFPRQSGRAVLLPFPRRRRR
jgi:hypothetical protein